MIYLNKVPEPVIPSVFLDSSFSYSDSIEGELEAIHDADHGWWLYHRSYLTYDQLYIGLIKIGRRMNILPTFKTISMFVAAFDPRKELLGVQPVRYEPDDYTIVLKPDEEKLS